MEPDDVAVVFFDMAGLPGWGSEAGPTDPDTSTILERYLGPVGADIRLVQGYTALVVSTNVRGALLATMDLLREAMRSSGSATAGAHVTRIAPDDVGPMARCARTAATLSELADADRLLVTGDVVIALEPVDGSVLSFDAGPRADIDGDRLATYSVRRR